MSGPSAVFAAAKGVRPALTRRWVIAGLVAIVVIFLAVDPQWTTQSIRPPAQSSSTQSSNFDPTDYVNKHWASEILPTVLHNAVDLPTLLADLKSNEASTAKKYGNTAETGGQPTFPVKGTATVTAVNSSNIPTLANLAFGASHKTVAQMQLGPILTGTDVRDAMRFISFNQFTDQVTYSEVATAINTKINTTALSKINNKSLVGKKVTFYGAFTYTPGTTPLVTPVTLKVAK